MKKFDGLVLNVAEQFVFTVDLAIFVGENDNIGFILARKTGSRSTGIKVN